ncbi:MAG: hypothetical protein UX91_C0006G0229 [Candidatus Amesbacteria bacterium GW2011_GWB1_47_19]|nr:MAG: hypothetical protein UW51_C0002G0230 [Candidatus Amesbacteria bacterium GW2011_GWA1_44_24]KKU31009.1 MAG: hypothetical protein UX46_C0008G0029 [Candidatus Amesbacteria bacterium GW2011_GWC1_46_24]KKU67167.1 MAG: hypothetical protein UX91_C0006G0229 [Candidatus Amesbacteria bacterium GW2011_GWB1_47_19]OGD05524.1 MAG: hypothetical protein A2379_01020 [Candidatus Amesbacteria bacterium RIFOXYB1_FULL_47_13]HBC73041.1 hypothetical protein [Candidatus Amesbacteria bacterium]
MIGNSNGFKWIQSMNDELRLLEKRVFEKPKSASAEDLDKLAKFYWEEYAKERNIRKKIKPIRKAAYFAARAVKAGKEDLMDLELYLRILRAERKSTNPAYENGKNFSLVTGKYLQISGLGEVKILREIKGGMAIESGTVGVGESGILNLKDIDFSKQDTVMIEIMQRGQAVFVDAGGDGNMGAKIRLIDSPEPVLKPTEYRKTVGASEVYVINLPKGKLRMADAWDLAEGTGGVGLEVNPGNYKIAVYMLEDRSFFGFWAVLCKTDNGAVNEVREIEALG